MHHSSAVSTFREIVRGKLIEALAAEYLQSQKSS